jgi:hypothetical protein
MTHKKVSTLDPNMIDQFRIIDTQIIMKRIEKQTPKTVSLSIRNRWILAVNVFVIALVIGLSMILGNPTNPNPDPTFEEVYEDLINLQDILHSLRPDSTSEVSNSSLIPLIALNPDYVKDYDYLYNLYQDNEIDYSYTDHDEYFLMASEHFDLFIDILTMYDYIPLFKWVDSVDNDSIDRFKIMVHDNGYFTIATMRVVEPYYNDDDPYEEYNVFYLGLTEENNFEMEHIRYEGDINITGYETNYQYYQYSQNKQTKYINVDRYGTTVDFVSFVNNERYYFSKDHENFYDGVSDQTVYSVHYTSFNDNNNYSISFTDETILSEQYTVYNEYGTVFTYKDRDTTDSILNLQYNLMEATGWDYASFHPTDSEQAGIYQNDIKLFPDQTVTLNKAYKNVQIGLLLEVLQDEITNEILDLSEYGLTFYDGVIDLDYLANMRITDINSVTNNFAIDGLDFATLQDKEGLYNSLRSILKNSILVIE